MKREMIEVGAMIRVENGPARKTSIATKELLDDSATASHYQVGMKDAMGAVIELGQPMTYLDYKGDWVWYVYKKEGGRFLPMTIEADKERALKVARAIKPGVLRRIFRR